MRTTSNNLTLLAVAIAALQSGAVTAQDSEVLELEEIVVTALRREQTLSSAPVAITAVSGEDLISNGVVDSSDLPNILPNVQVGVAGFSIRGVASADFTEKGDPSTAYNLNGIYIGRFTEQSLTLFDVDRVEVLRGPQGTLYGRNATAGVINVIAARPHSDHEASIATEFGNFDTQRVNAMLNAPLTDSVNFRVAGSYNKRDGFTKTRDGNDALDDQNDYAIRSSLSFDLGETTDLYVAVDYAKSDLDGGPASIAADRALAQNDKTSLRYQNPGVDTYSKFSAGGITLELNSDFGFANLTYLFGYRESEWRERSVRNDIPTGASAFSNGDFTSHQDHDQDSHELRLASTGDGPWQWVAGLYYFHETTYTAPHLNFVNFGFTLDYDLHASARTYAGFGEVTYELSDTIRITGGLRYTDDTKSRSGTQIFGLNGTDLAFPSNYDGRYPGGGISGDETTWKLGLEFDVTDSIMLYTNATSGYKAGGFNDGSPADESPVPFYYEPETITSFETGLKGDVMDGQLYFSLTGFYYDYQDLQLGLVKSTGGQVTQNIPKADIKGLELEGFYHLTENTKLDYSFSYLDANYDDFFPLQSDTSINFKGTQLDRSPEYSGRLALSHDMVLNDGGRVNFTAAIKYSDSYVVTDGNTATQIEQESYTRTDLTVGYFSADDTWYLQAFGKNLENERQLGMFELGAFTLTDPRLYGVRFGYNF